ncbi:MAG TPA: DivIVA domain-containing protein [Jatrophihabitans sp.]
MPLTPAEVHNVVFKKPPIGKRGYDEEEVDAFLDIIEVELARLIEENKDLRDHVENSGGAPVAAGSVAGNGADAAALTASREEIKKLTARSNELEASLAQARQAATKAQQDLNAAQQEMAAHQQRATAAGGDAAALATAREEGKRLAARVSELEAGLSRAQQEAAAARAAAQSAAQAAPAAGAAGAAAGSAAGSLAHLSQAERVLALAQQAADEQTAAAKAHQDKTIADMKAHTERVQADAKAFHEKTVSDAQSRAEQLDRESRSKAASTVQEAEQRAAQITTQLEQRKAALEKRLEELRTFEHEYRSRLKSYLESQLHDLDASGRAEPSQDKQGADNKS